MFVRNNVLYSVGGDPRVTTPIPSTEGYIDVVRKFDAIGIDIETGNITYTDNGGYACDLCRNGAKAVYLPRTDRALFFGGFSQNDNSSDSTTLFVGEYSFQSNVWRTLMENEPMSALEGDQNSTLPRNTNNLTATLAPSGNIYLRFQTVLGNPISIWSYNTAANTLNRVQLQPTNDEFLSSSDFVDVALPDGRIVYISSIGSAVIVDTNTNRYTVQNLDGADDGDLMTLELVRYYGYPFLVSNNSRYIYYYGGYGYPTHYRKVYSNDLSALDTETWTWTQVPVNKDLTPKMRGGTTVGLLYDQYLVVAHGASAFSWYNDFDVLKLPESISPNNTGGAAWVANITDPGNEKIFSLNDDNTVKKELTNGAIAGIAIGATALFCIGGLVWWFFWRDTAMNAFYYFVWEPRAGEPFWIEFLHLVTKTVLTGLFLAYVVYNIILVLNSPVTQWTITEPVDYVSLPDIRFCIEGAKRSSMVDCETESISAIDCNNMGVIDFLNATLHKPYSTSDYYDSLQCVLFSPGDKMRLSKVQSQTSNNGRVRFIYRRLDLVPPTEIKQREFRVHVELYPPGKNPNLVVYNNTDQPYLTEDDLNTWKYSDQNDLQRPNTYTLEFGQYGSISYQLQNHSYLTSSSWNHFGFAQHYNNIPEITTSFESTNVYNEGRFDVSTVHTVDVYPASYERVTVQDRKIYTFVSVLGSAGGLLSLLIVINAFLYGYRPKSPWGVVHRFSMGPMRRSLLQSLHGTFGFMGRPITFVDPVHDHLYREGSVNRDFRSTPEASAYRGETNCSNQDQWPDIGHSTSVATSSNIEQRLAQMEQRLRQAEELERRFNLMELMFKEYYTNNEVFENLLLAHNNALPIERRKNYGDVQQSQDEFLDSKGECQTSRLLNLIRRTRSKNNEKEPVASENTTASDIETATSRSMLLRE
ncbi:hypothetical protein BJV82DRAFT_624851 [Fennellomyces sp. T-0311]|nr:hypothetical protein BJV82DRAFT_624851 [Fennellomyces sp. T-0311]